MNWVNLEPLHCLKIWFSIQGRLKANVFDDEIRDAVVTAIEEDKEVELEEREESDKGNL